MAILVAIFGKIKQIFSSYVLTTKSESPSTSPFIIGTSPYSMPLVYLIILGCIALIGYFCWQSYRQEIHEEKLQERSASKEDNFSSYNLTWINKLINWVYMSSLTEIPEAVKRWMEDINLTLAKNKNPIKILVYGIREGSIPPWIRDVGQPQKIQDHIEFQALLDVPEFGFTISVQEEDKGKVIASTYTAVVSQFQCWYNVIVSRIEGQGFLAKLEALSDRPSTVKFNLKLQSDQKISSTVPEVVADILKKGVLDTPFYLNLSTWSPVIPIKKQRKTSKDNNGNNVSPKRVKRRSKRSQGDGKANETPLRRQTDQEVESSPDIFTMPPENEESLISGESSTMPTKSFKVLSNHIHGLSGSLGSLVGIKRTPSGRGPAKPIRSREKCLLIKVTKVTSLPNDGVVYCRATLDYPHQSCETKPDDSGSHRSWPNDDLMFDLSSRSSEVKLILYQAQDGKNEGEDSAVATAVLCLDRIDVDKSTELSLPLRTVNKEENARITVELDFTENPVDVTSQQKFSSPRRSLDLSLIANHLPPIVHEKGSIKSKSLASTLSSFSSENMSATGSLKGNSLSTTVRTTTTKKVSPKRKSPGLPISQSAPNMQPNGAPESKSDVAMVEGTVAEIAMKDLSEQAEIAKHSPQAAGNLKKGKVIITAVCKTNINGETHPNEIVVVNGIDETAHESDPSVKLEKTAEMYYSTDSLHVPPSSGSTSPRSDKENEKDTEKPVSSGTHLKQRAAATKPKKSRRTDERTKSLVSGVRAEEMPGTSEMKEWPKVRRSRSLVFGRGKKKQYKSTGSSTDLHKRENAKDSAGYGDDSSVTVPENDLQKNSKKKKSRSITKIFSKLGRKPSIKKSKKDSDIAEVVGDQSVGGFSQNSMTSDPMSTEDDKNIHISPSTKRPSSSVGSEADSLLSEVTSPAEPSLSIPLSLNDEKGVKRSKSLRKRLFGGMRKSTKN